MKLKEHNNYVLIFLLYLYLNVEYSTPSLSIVKIFKGVNQGHGLGGCFVYAIVDTPIQAITKMHKFIYTNDQVTLAKNMQYKRLLVDELLKSTA